MSGENLMKNNNPLDGQLDRLRQLRLAGIPVEIDDDESGNPHAPQSGVFIRQVDRGSSAIELNPYETGYAVHIRIVPNLGWSFWISSYRLYLP
jgi:hypothetical protein